MGEPDIEVSIKAFEENRRLTDPADAYNYNLAVGLLNMSRAIKEIQDRLVGLHIQARRTEKSVKDLEGT